MWRSVRIAFAFIGPLIIATSAQSQQAQKTVPSRRNSPYKVLATAFDPGNAPLNSGSQARKMAVGEVLAQDGDFRDSIVQFRAVLRQQPNLAVAHYDLGLALLGSANSAQRWPKAMAQFRTALQIRPKYPEARNLLAVGMLVNGNPEGSIKELEIAANEAPGMAEIHLDLGKAFCAVGRWKSAAGELQNALKLRHPYPEAQAELGDALLNQGEVSAAENAFRRALRGNPDIESAHYGLARTLRAEGKSAEADVEFKEVRALLQQKSDAVMSSNLSNQSLSLARQGKAVEAARMAKRAVELEPANWAAIYNYGLLLADTGNLRGGIDEIRKAISIMPLQRELYLTMAKMQKRLGETEAEECTLKRADDFLALATAHDGQGDLAKPEAKSCQVGHGKFAFGASFGSVDKHRAFASYLSRKGDLLGASGELLYAAKLAPSNSDIRYSLGIVWLQLGRLQEANLELHSAIILSPQSSRAHFALATVLVEQSQYKAAEGQLREALHLDPGDQEAQRMLAEIADRDAK
jgi:tetratricopeptide (TPR) repeat protein